MSMTTLSRQLRLMLRGEILVIKAELAFAARRGAMLAFALLFAGLGLVFLNMGLYAWLSPLWGPVWTPAGLGLINLGLALAAIVVAAVAKPGPELQLAEEIRDMAGETLEAEIRSAPLLGMLGGGASGGPAAAGLLVPAISMIIGALGKRREKARKAEG
jgi:hypothetical protein